jgi:dolichol-phosphate mannosyltransferase
VSAGTKNIFFSIIIPAHNEEDLIENTCRSIAQEFEKERIDDYEILIVNDNSTDQTEQKIVSLQNKLPNLWYVNNTPPHGYGFAVRRGLDAFKGEVACVVMADLSDSPGDIVRYYRETANGSECVFGSRFLRESKVHDYPVFKLILNRLANWFIKVLFNTDYNDTTNAFKCYRREVIEGIQPILSHHFNLTVELPLKAIVRGYQYKIIPISWTNRVAGVSKLKIKEMGSRYLFIILYVFLEKMLSRGDYKRVSKKQARQETEIGPAPKTIL